MIEHSRTTTRSAAPLKSKRDRPLARVRWDRVLFLIAYIGVWVVLVMLAGAAVRLLFGG